jgi:uncharacterized glyoxalase superfamily metalloenzyme YdcJ
MQLLNKILDRQNQKFVAEYDIRKMLAEKASERFGSEVPEYVGFTEIVKKSNQEYLEKNPNAEIDSEHRVLAEKHGAIRTGTAYELETVARAFAVLGCFPCGFYDMTQLQKNALPIMGTAFRPIDDSIDKSAFRMFCSYLHPDYVTEDIKELVEGQLSSRGLGNKKFSKEFLDLIDKYEKNGGLTIEQAEKFTNEFVKTLEFNKDRAIDFKAYKNLRLKNDVFADIVCLGININHLTPRAYDIEDALNKLIELGIPVKEGGMEGPPIRKSAEPIQLNQTSRKAPGEYIIVSNTPEDNIKFKELIKTVYKLESQENESVESYLERVEKALNEHKYVAIQHKARFGEIESRGIALTEKGIESYTQHLEEKRFKNDFPKTKQELFEKGYIHFTYEIINENYIGSAKSLDELLKLGVIKIKPQTYDDFLAQSAAGIFGSNLSLGSKGSENDNIKSDTINNKLLMEKALDCKLINPHDVYRANNAKSILEVYEKFGIEYSNLEAEKLNSSIEKINNNFKNVKTRLV